MIAFPRLHRCVFVLVLLIFGLSSIGASVQAQTSPAATAQLGLDEAAWADEVSIRAQIARWQRPGAPAPASIASVTAAPELLADFESEVINLVNIERKKNDPTCPNLTLHPTLRQVAYAHSKDMADRGFFSHTNPDGDGPGDRIDRTNYDYSTWGENIAAGYETPAAVMDGWMNSPGHRSNILNCRFLDIGVGYYYKASSDWEYYWTQVFGRQRNATDPAPEPEPNPELNRAAFLPLALKRTGVVPQPNPGSVLTNGDFEAGPGVGWSENSTVLEGNTGIIITESPDLAYITPRSGRYLAWLGGLYDDVSTLSQEVTLPTGALKLEYAYRLFSVETLCTNDTGEIAVVRGNSVNVLASIGLCRGAESAGWVVKQVDLTPYAGQQWTIRIRVKTNTDLNSNIFFDDIKLVAGGSE